MTIKQRIRDALAREHLTSKQLADNLRLQYRSVQVAIGEMKAELEPCGHRREGRRGPPSYLWRLA